MVKKYEILQINTRIYCVCGDDNRHLLFFTTHLSNNGQMLWNFNWSIKWQKI